MSYRFETNGTLKPMNADDLAAADANSSVIELSQGRLEDGSPYWAYIAVKPSKYKEFKLAVAEQRAICLTEYGSILKYGFDKQVPNAVKEHMKRDHGCDDNCLAVLTADIKKAQTVFLKQQEDMRIGDIVAVLKKMNPQGG